MTVSYWLKCTYDEKDAYQVRPRIICKDGFEISVQGGDMFHYCFPRSKANVYDEVECGYPSDEESELLRYAENRLRPTDTVYGYVPISVIERIVEKHGGIVGER